MSQDEMERFIEAQTNEILIRAYKEMLQGCLEHPKQWVWYAIWMIELKDGTPVGNLSFNPKSPLGLEFLMTVIGRKSEYKIGY